MSLKDVSEGETQAMVNGCAFNVITLQLESKPDLPIKRQIKLSSLQLAGSQTFVQWEMGKARRSKPKLLVSCTFPKPQKFCINQFLQTNLKKISHILGKFPRYLLYFWLFNIYMKHSSYRFLQGQWLTFFLTFFR